MGDDFPQLVEGFFLQWMDAGRRLPALTTASYRGAFALLLRWFREERGVPASAVGMGNSAAENVDAFLPFPREEEGA